MAYPRLRAEVFVSSSGVAVLKAPALPRRECLRIYRRDGGICQNCGATCRFGGNQVAPFEPLKSSAVDHIFPRSRGGQNDDANLQLLCKSCNSQKVAS